jgi:hypothetical protein
MEIVWRGGKEDNKLPVFYFSKFRRGGAPYIIP